MSMKCTIISPFEFSSQPQSHSDNRCNCSGNGNGHRNNILHCSSNNNQNSSIRQTKAPNRGDRLTIKEHINNPEVVQLVQ